MYKILKCRNKTLSLLYDWLCVNKLSLNTNKTKFILFHFHQKHINVNNVPILKINNDIIEKVDSFKFLGLDFDST